MRIIDNILRISESINKVVNINHKGVGSGHGTYLIAEIGLNHNGSMKIAEKLIIEAKKNGADIIKFQTYKAEKLVTRKAARFWKWDGEINKKGSQFDSYKRLDKFNFKEYQKLSNLCKKYKIEFMSTPFDLGTASFDNVSMNALNGFGGQTSQPRDAFFTPNGLKLFIMEQGAAGNSRLVQYTLSSPHDLSTVAGTTSSILWANISGGGSIGDRIFDTSITSDGTKMFGINYYDDIVYQYSTGN